MSGVTAIIGEGLLAVLVNEQLSAAGDRVVRLADLGEGVPREADFCLVLSDGWDPSTHLQAEEWCRQTGTPWLRGFVAFGEGVVGPLVRPGIPGCSRCADLRRVMAGSDRKETWQLQHTGMHTMLPERDAWASRTGMFQMAVMLAEETRRVRQGLPAHSENRLFLVNLQTFNCTRHFFLPDPLCPVCGKVPDDEEESARIALHPSPKVSAQSYRSRPMEALNPSLVRDYLDFRTGFLNGSMQDLTAPFADASVNLPLFTGDEGTAGRTHSYAESRLTAILEGLERYCGLSPRGKRTVVHDSYRNLEDRALHPAAVGLHEPGQYEQPGFPFRPFDPEQPIDWVWGYSFLQERPILVPETLAYYNTGCGQGFVYETSNGCALGGSLEEAIFYGILEVVERDSFLLTWYAQLPLPRIDPYSSGDTELGLMLDRLRSVAGYEVLLFNSTMEHGIPSIWSIAKNRTGKGLNLICAAGAHPDPIRAFKSSVHELAGMLLSQNEKFEQHKTSFVRMFEDPLEVKQMEDHSMLYGLPEAETRFAFLLNQDRPMRTFQQEFEQSAWHPDLTDDLKMLLQAFRRLDMDVIVVNQSTPETLRNGLHCVKVIIPGTLPMTFGYQLTRLTGLDRVLKVPAKLGYVERPLTHDQLNSHPHPFP
ncbi:MAG: bacteriocin biosynthesis protein SagD [Cohnella sp.]|nr:bacteriocin biosynthesis protein SagD [Cohnella sp.]